MEKSQILLLEALPASALLLNAEFAILHENAGFQRLMALAAHEFKSEDLARKEFVRACRIHQNRSAWQMRIFDSTDSGGGIIGLQVYAGRPCLSGGERIILILEESIGTESGTLRETNYFYGPFRIDFESEIALFHREIIPLSAAEYRLLKLFATNEGRVLSKQEIKKEIWGSVRCNPRASDILAGRLKAKLSASGLPEDLIKTVRARGYRFSPEPLFPKPRATAPSRKG